MPSLKTVFAACVVLALLVPFVEDWLGRSPGPHGSSKGAAMAQVGILAASVDLYHQDVSAYPTSFGDLLQPPADGKGAWNGPYLKDLPADPWGKSYRYRRPGLFSPESYDIWSAGPDGLDGTNDDIGNWLPSMKRSPLPAGSPPTPPPLR